MPNFSRREAATSGGTAGFCASSPNGSPGASASTVNSTKLIPSKLGMAMRIRRKRYWLTKTPPKKATGAGRRGRLRSEEHTSELQSLMRIPYAVFCSKKKNQTQITYKHKQ